MKNCVLSEIQLVSFVEKKAKRITFDPIATTIVGENDTGKSALLKSIYWTFGAEPAETHPKWEAANVASFVRFTIDGERHAVLRQGDAMALFTGSNDELVGSFTSVTKGLGPALAVLFDFGMVQSDKQGQTIIPPPAFYLLPFYVDQDRSWVDNWAGFAKLQQLANYRQFMAEYHSGLRPNQYYETSAELEAVRRDLDVLKAELAAIEGARKTFDEHLPFRGFNMDPEAFAEDVARLLDQCELLGREEDKYRWRVQDLRTQEATVQMQLRLVEREAEETKLDYQFATSSKTADAIECPVCGTFHQNSFAERFAIARDEDRCRDLILQLREDQNGLTLQVEKARAAFDRAARERTRVEQILATKRETVRLKDIIEAQGRTEVQRIFADNIKGHVISGRSLEVEIERLNGSLKKLEDRKRKARILGFYRSKMREYLDELDVQNLIPKSYENIAAKIREIGSDKPRALLAYYYSFLETAREFGSSVFCPIVIDEPNQQGLDPNSLPAVLKFIFSRQPDDTQLILGVENLHGVAPRGTVIKLEQKWSLLTEYEYEDVASVVRPLLTSTFRMAQQ